MVKTIGASLVLALVLPSAAMAQSVIVPADRVAHIRRQLSAPAPIARQGPFAREALLPVMRRTIQTAPASQLQPERSWAGRHPAALGAMIGAAAGAVVGSSPCWKSPCGDGHGPMLVGLGAGVGAGIGSAVGFTVSLGGR